VATYHVDYLEFTEVWMDVFTTGGKTETVAKRLGITVDACMSRAALLRRKGVKLPYLNKSGMITRTEVEQMNNLIEKRLRNRVPVTPKKAR
jgi:hypothetical protein